MFSCEFCQISTIIFLHQTPLVAASVYHNLVLTVSFLKRNKLQESFKVIYLRSSIIKENDKNPKRYPKPKFAIVYVNLVCDNPKLPFSKLS